VFYSFLATTIDCNDSEFGHLDSFKVERRADPTVSMWNEVQDNWKMRGTPFLGSPGDDGHDLDRSDTDTVTDIRTKIKKPSMYKVLLLNDDYTPMEFVVLVVEHIFSKGREEATNVMLHVHQHGVGLCGVYTYEVAETKVTQVMDFARQYQHPLQCTMEKD
jgi:ATP-dependent Clp protease adaptor protein ClpS